MVRRALPITSQTQPFILHAAGLEGELRPLPAGEITVFGNRRCAGVSWTLEFRRLGDLPETPAHLSGPSVSGTLPVSGSATALITLAPGTYRCSIEGSEGIDRFRIFGIDENYVQSYDPENFRRNPNQWPSYSSEAAYIWRWSHSGESSSDVPVSSTRYLSVPQDFLNPPDNVYYFWVDGEQGTNWSLDCQRRS